MEQSPPYPELEKNGSLNGVKVKNYPLKSLIIAISLMVFFSSISSIIGYKLGRNNNQQAQSKKTTNNSSQANPAKYITYISPVISPTISNLITDQTSQTENTMIYPSPNNYSYFLMYADNSVKDECFFVIVNDAGQPIGYNIKKILNTNKIYCYHDMGYGASAFQKWVDDYKIIFKEKDETIKIIDILDSKIETFNYDKSQLTFVDVNKSLKYWLFKKKSDEYSFLLTDSNKKIIYDKKFNQKSPGSDNIYVVLYDDINDGFLFISHNLNEGKVLNKFDFLSLNDFSYRTLLAAGSIEAEGRGGCRPPKLYRTLPGDISIDPGCIGIAEEYIKSDKKVHISVK